MIRVALNGILVYIFFSIIVLIFMIDYVFLVFPQSVSRKSGPARSETL
jgi:hypothetical protein